MAAAIPANEIGRPEYDGEFDPSDGERTAVLTQLVDDALAFVTKAFRVGKSLNRELRAGVHCGALVSGVVGTRRLAFDVWGSTVNIAARLESSSERGRVQVSQDVVDAASSRDFQFEHRGHQHLKGMKNDMMTYFLKLSN